MIWWLFQSSRLAAEKAALAELEGSADWLEVGGWHINSDLAMCVDFAIAHNRNLLGFKMTYPIIFPDTPPKILTDDRKRHFDPIPGFGLTAGAFLDAG